MCIYFSFNLYTTTGQYLLCSSYRLIDEKAEVKWCTWDMQITAELSVKPRLHVLNSYDAVFPFGREIKECLLLLSVLYSEFSPFAKLCLFHEGSPILHHRRHYFYQKHIKTSLLCRREYVGAGERLEFFLKVGVCPLWWRKFNYSSFRKDSISTRKLLFWKL